MQYANLRSKGFVLPNRLTALYDGGSNSGSRTRNWNPSSLGPGAAAASQLPTIRRRARDAIRNDPWAKTAINRLVSNAIGTGIQPHPQHADKNVRVQLKKWWEEFVKDSDADGMLDFYGQQALATRCLFGDGESYGRLRLRKPSDGLAVPLQLQLLESDHLPVEKNESLPGGAQVINGVEFDSVGRRVAYHMWRQHPTDYPRASNVAQSLTRIPADQIIPMFQVLRPGQVRGVSELATVLLRLKSLDNLDDAVLFRQEVANLFAGFITRPEATGVNLDPMTGLLPTMDGDGFTPLSALEPGTLQQLEPGEEITFAEPPDAGNVYEGFMRHQLMAAAASCGLPYELLTGDLRNIGDRALRVLINEFHRHIEQIQWLTVIPQFCQRVWEAFIDALALSGVMPMPDYYRNRREYLRVRWVPQGWPYFHPVQDIAASVAAINAGLSSRSGKVLAQGDDPEKIDEENAQDNERAKSLGLVYSTDTNQLLVEAADAEQQNNKGK
nr:MAG TPA: portal protein [Caudoviricetes sp.]